MDSSGSAIVKVGKGNFILSSNLISDYDFVDIIELVPIFIIVKLIFVKWFKLWSTGYSYVQSFRSVKALFIK